MYNERLAAAGPGGCSRFPFCRAAGQLSLARALAQLYIHVQRGARLFGRAAFGFMRRDESDGSGVENCRGVWVLIVACSFWDFFMRGTMPNVAVFILLVSFCFWPMGDLVFSHWAADRRLMVLSRWSTDRVDRQVTVVKKYGQA